jgi:hypothetical protein
VPPNVQAQINQAQSYMQAAQTVKQSDPSYNGWSAAAAQYRKAEAAFRAAGDLARASAAAEQALTLENALKIADQKAGQNAAPGQPPPSLPGVSPSASTSQSCPPAAPASNWQGTPNEQYCANANCVERGSAYYGMICFSTPQRNGSPNATGASGQLPQMTSDQREKTKNAWTNAQRAIQNARPGQRRAALGAVLTKLLHDDPELLLLIPQYLGCQNESTDSVKEPQTAFFNCIDQQLAKLGDDDTAGDNSATKNDKPTDIAQEPPSPLVTIDPQKYKSCKQDNAAPDRGIMVCWLEASNGYCKKWRERPDGSKLPYDYDRADKQSFSDDVVNAAIYTQHCPPEADWKWIEFWESTRKAR